MKTTIQHKLAAAIIAMLPAALSAQEHIEADIGADIVSGYIWRTGFGKYQYSALRFHQLQRNMVIRMGNGRI